MNSAKGSSFFPFGKEQLLPAEEMLEVGRKRKQLSIGVLSGKGKDETRIPLTPQAVELLVKNDHEVIIESKAGDHSSYSDMDYANAGAGIIRDKKVVLQCDIVLSVAPLDHAEIDALKGNQTIISSMQLKTQCEEALKKMMKKKVLALAFEYMKDEHRQFPVINSMCEIAGSTSMMMASEYMSNAHGGKGVLLGGVTGISPAEVVIIGSGVAAEYAVRTAIGLGAMVKVFDSSIHNLRVLNEKIGTSIFTSVFHPHVLQKALKSADVVLGALTFPSCPKFIVPEEYVKEMKEGAVIIDLCISHGGCFETSVPTTLKRPTFRKHGIVHCCVPNIPARVARTASISLSNIFAPILLDMGECGGLERYMKSSKGFRNGVYIYNGILTSLDLGEKFNLPHQDIELLMAAF
ncbi:alanine dehydrogenase [Prolixibacteraceae bacterium JC049]|nr:alanine dehydrogenase [Prolixibacteraceae bacterium JC049]